MKNFVEVQGRHFEFHDAQMWLYHCASSEADWVLRLTRVGEAQTMMWLSGSVGPSPKRPTDLHEGALVIESEALDELFGELLGAPLTIYPNGQDVCRAHFVAEWGEEGLELVCAFDYDWDRALDEDEPEQEHEEPLRRARLEFRVCVEGLHAGALPEDLPPST